jgi:hypothetical protein
VKGRVAHLPYSFQITIDRAGALEVNIADEHGRPLDAFPKTIANAFGDTAHPTTQQFDIPFSERLAHAVERKLFDRNQHLTQIQLVVERAR